MSAESDFIAALRAMPLPSAARGLRDDAAVLELGGTKLVLTHDMIVEGIHFLPDDPPGDVAWKLVAVNLSDLAGKGARPLGILLGFSLGQDRDWDRAFLKGLESALHAFGIGLLGGDTVAAPAAAPRFLGMTALGEATGAIPSRSGGRDGDILWVSGSIGDAGAGLKLATGQVEASDRASDELIERYRTPRPRLEAGQALAPLVSAMMDVSDGLLIDAQRMAAASGVKVVIALDAVPLSGAYLAVIGDDRAARIAAATAGDDYELLFAARHNDAPRIHAISERFGLAFTQVGRFTAGSGLELRDGESPVALPPALGFEHERRLSEADPRG